jgi:hypothetical protein
MPKVRSLTGGHACKHFLHCERKYERCGRRGPHPPISDRYGVSAIGGTGPAGLNLRDCDGEALASTALPLTPPDVNLFHPNCSVGDEVVI